MIDAVPHRLGQLAAAGSVIAGLLPVADFFRLESSFEPLGHFGIAVRGRVRSVMLFSRRPLRQLDGAIIGVTEETSTSALLLRLLLEQRYRLTPASYQRVPSEAARLGSPQRWEGDALLLIGDEALRSQHSNAQYPFEIDLAFEWWLWRHLPFVFGLWAVRKDASAQHKKQIEAGLARALAMNLGQLQAIGTEYAQPLGAPAAELTAYLAAFHYRLGPEETQAMAEFRELVQTHGLLE